MQRNGNYSDMKSSAAVNRRLSGFTLVEIMIVLVIISILALAAIPTGRGRVNKAYIGESLQLIKPFEQRISDYYTVHGLFPEDNAAVGLPEPSLITGNYLASVEVVNGTLQLTLGQKIGNDLQGKVLSVRPVYVPDYPAIPISWICGYDEVPENMATPEENHTDIPRSDLPLTCL